MPEFPFTNRPNTRLPAEAFIARGSHEPGPLRPNAITGTFGRRCEVDAFLQSEIDEAGSVQLRYSCILTRRRVSAPAAASITAVITAARATPGQPALNGAASTVSPEA